MTEDTRKGVLRGSVLGIGMVITNYFGFLGCDCVDNLKTYFKFHYLLKLLQGLVLILITVVKLVGNHTALFSIFSIIGIVCFVLQYIPLFYLLKWGNNGTPDACPWPNEVFVYRPCSKKIDGLSNNIEGLSIKIDGLGGAMRWTDYERIKHQQR